MAEDRRTLLKVLTGVLGGGVACAVGGPALRAAVAPFNMRTVTGVGEFVTVAPFDALPTSGSPVNVPVVIDAPLDGWTRHPPTTVGGVFLKREGDSVRAWSTICPHLGCGIDYNGDEGKFACPCHESWFNGDGAVASGPSPRGMDELETRLHEGQVQVKFEKFKIGTSERVSA